MASTIKVSLNISDNGSMELTTRSAAKLKKELDAVGASASQVSKALSSAKMRTEGISMGGVGKEENIDYRRARGVAGTGGGGTRDFAKQAQGLGGLVQLYATFAANIYAVGAAYTSLETAFRTERLMQASEILGPVMGLSIKNLSKDLQEATGYAISFQDSMKFSNMGLAAGLSAKQITNLTIVAKGAANALGRDMGDAIQRIISGTAKQEQEILDELGIFVKARTAYKEYADQLNLTSEDQLTAAQRVTAYANAVEKAGEKWKKFAEIDDPFAKFTATTREAGAELLNIVNKVIAPILGYLAEFKSVVEGLILLVTVKLAKMALPAIGSVLTNFFKVDTAAIKAEAAMAAKVYSEHINTKIGDLAKTKPGTKGLQAVLGTGEIGKSITAAGLVPSLAASIVAQKSVTTEADSIKIFEASANKRAGAISRIKDATEKQLKLDALVNTGLLQNIDGTNKYTVIKGKEAEIHNLVQAAVTKENAALLEQKRITAEISSLRGRTGTASPDTSKEAIKLSNATALNVGVAGISTALMSNIGVMDKVKSSWTIAKETIAATTGILPIAGTAFRLFGTVVSSALKLVMGPIGWLLMAFSLWDLAIKPILQSMGLLNPKIDEVKESTNRLTEATDIFIKTFEENADQLTKYQVSAAGASAQSALLSRAFTELAEKANDSFKEIKELEKAGWLDKLFRIDSRAATASLTAIGEAVQAELDVIDKADKQNIRKLQKIKGDIDGILESGLGTDYIISQSRSLQKSFNTVQSSIGKAQEATKAANDEIESYATVGVRAMKDLSAEINLNSDAFTHGLTNDKVKVWYTQTSNAIQSLSQGNVRAAGSVASLFAEIPESLKLANPDLNNLSKKIAEITKLSETNFAAAQAAAKDPAFIAMLKVLSETRAKEAQTLVTPIPKGREKADVQFSINNLQKEELSIKQKMLDLEIKEQDVLQQRVVKFTGLADKTIADRKYSIELQKIENEFEQRKLDIRGKVLKAQRDERKGTLNKEELKLITSAGKIAEQASIKEKAQAKENAALTLNNTLLDIANSIEKDNLKISERVIALDNTKLSVSKDLEELSAQEYIDKKYILDVTALQNKFEQDKVGLYGTALTNLEASLNLSKNQLEIEKTRNDILEARAALQRKFSTDQESVQQKIDASLRNNTSTVQLEVDLIQQKIAETERLNIINGKDGKALERNLALNKEILSSIERQLEARKRDFINQEDKPQIIYDEAAKRAREFAANLKDTVTGTFDAIYSGMDAAIDAITTKMMESTEISFVEIRDLFRNTVAEGFRSMAAEQMKSNARNLIKDIMGAVVPGLDLSTNEEKSLNLLERIALATETTATTTLEGYLPTEGTSSAIDDLENARTSAEYFANQAAEMPKTFTEMLKNQWDVSKGFFANLQGLLGTTLQFFGSSAVSIFKNILNSISGGGSSGGGGFLKTLFDVGMSFLPGLTSGGMTGTEMSAGFAASGQGMAAGNYMAGTSAYVPSWNDTNLAFPKFAMGGVMTDQGALSLNKYANGGIANSPQLAMYGEGRQPEAYVPLPDGRTIPVTMQGKSGGGEVNVNINITDNSTTSETSAAGTGKDYAAMAKLISSKVREELLNQKRPGGILY